MALTTVHSNKRGESQTRSLTKLLLFARVALIYAIRFRKFSILIDEGK